MLSLLSTGVNLSRIGFPHIVNATEESPLVLHKNETLAMASAVHVSSVPSPRDHMEILNELRYWMVLIPVFSLLSMFYVGLVLCIHLLYCFKSRGNIFRPLGTFDVESNRQPEIVSRPNAPGHDQSLLQILTEATDTSQQPPSYDLAVNGTSSEACSQPPSLGSAPTSPPDYDIGDESICLPDYATAVQRGIPSISGNITRAGLEALDQTPSRSCSMENRRLQRDPRFPLTDFILHIVNKLNVYA